MPTAKAARKSVNWAIAIIGGFYLMTIALGFGAAALIKPDEIIGSNKAGNTAAPLLAQHLGGGPGSTGGAVLLAAISAVAFATILAVVAGLTLASSSSFAHDLYANVIKQGPGHREAGDAAPPATPRSASAPCRIVLGALARDLNVAGLVALAFAVAASANLPTILYSLFWKRFTTRGALWSIYGGLVSAVGLVLFSPVVSGKPTSMFPDVRLPLVPAGEPRPHLHPARLPARLAGHRAVQGGAGRRQVRRAGGPLPDRHRSALTHGVARARRARTTVDPHS